MSRPAGWGSVTFRAELRDRAPEALQEMISQLRPRDGH